MKYPDEKYRRILIFHRVRGGNFILFVHGVDLTTNLDSELQSTFYTDRKVMKLEIDSIIRFLYQIGFKYTKDYLSTEGNRVFAFQK